MKASKTSHAQSLTDFQPEHIEEFKASAIDDITAGLNFYSFDAIDGSEDTPDIDEAFEILIPEPKHNNNGTLAGTSQQELAAILRSGGWWFKGHIGACVKPNAPRIDGKGRVIKYESPRGQGALQLFVPRISVRAGLEIASKLGETVEKEYLQRIELKAPSAEDPDFWDWYLEHDGFIIITEGTKKACSLVSNGYPAIALCGIWGWGTNDKDMFDNIEKDESGNILKTLHPDLEQFLVGREVALAFDRDTNPDTAKKVEAAKRSFRKHLDGIASKVTDIKWNNKDGKGIDDFIKAKGIEALDKVFSKRIEVKSPPPPKEKKPTFLGFSSSIETGLVAIALGEDGKELPDKDGKPKSELIGNHLVAIATLDNPDGNGSAFLLEFKTFKGTIGSWTMPREYMAGDGSLLIQELYKRKYSFIREKKSMLLDYLSTLGGSIEQEYIITDSSGWVGESFVLPHKTHGDENLKFRDVEPSPEAITEMKGTLQGWKDGVAARCADNSRLILAIGSSFAAPLLPIADVESGGFHLVGATSKGKTTILSVAASVTGVKDIPHWRTTTNGLESIATAFNHLCLPLDEIGQADPKDVGNIAYMLANGQGKTRMNKNLTNRKPKTWELMVLSSGEVGMGGYMAQANITQKGGQEVRLPDVPAIPKNSSYGCFETIHGAATAVQFVGALEASVKEHHGTALDAFLSRLVVDKADPSFAGNLSKQVHLIATKLAEGTKDSAIGRVAKRFALVQVALGLAHKYGLLPFPAEQIDWAISECFNAWLKERGGDGSIEIKSACDEIRALIISNLHSDRVYDLKDRDVTQKVRDLLGYAEGDANDAIVAIWMPPPTFSKTCKMLGVNEKELIAELQFRKWLAPNASDDRPTHQKQIKKKSGRYFKFLPLNFQDDEKHLDDLDDLDDLTTS